MSDEQKMNGGEKQPEQGEHELSMSDGVKALMPYFGLPVAVQMKEEWLVVMDCVSVVGIPGADGKPEPAGVAGPASFVDPATNERLPPRVSDLLTMVMLQPAPCGQRVAIVQQTGPNGGPDDSERSHQSGAVMVTFVFPEEIRSITRVATLPPEIQKAAAKQESRIVMPD